MGYSQPTLTTNWDSLALAQSFQSLQIRLSPSLTTAQAFLLLQETWEEACLQNILQPSTWHTPSSPSPWLSFQWIMTSEHSGEVLSLPPSSLSFQLFLSLYFFSQSPFHSLSPSLCIFSPFISISLPFFLSLCLSVCLSHMCTHTHTHASACNICCLSGNWLYKMTTSTDRRGEERGSGDRPSGAQFPHGHICFISSSPWPSRPFQNRFLYSFIYHKEKYADHWTMT